MHTLNCVSPRLRLVLSLSFFLAYGSAGLYGQTVVFQTGFEYDSEPELETPADLNGAIDQVGTWSGDAFPEGIGNIHPPATAGFQDHPDNGTRLLVIDRPTTSDGSPGREVLSYVANLTDDIFTAGATFSFEGGTRRTGGNHAKDWDLIGLDSDGNESFHLTVDTDLFQGLGYISGDVGFYDLPTVEGESRFGDLPNIGGVPFDANEIGSITVNLGTNGYVVNFEHARNSYRTETLPYNGSATELSSVAITYSASDNTGLSSGYVLDNLLVSGRKVSEGALTPGDFNSDGKVDMGDFVTLAGNFNTKNTTFEQGDNNFDGSVDIHDFLEWRAVYQAQPQGAAAVPEPHTFWLVLCGLWSLSLVRRR